MEMINVGYVAGFHGLKGEMKIKTTTDFVQERFAVGSELILVTKDRELTVKVKSYREHKGVPLISFEGYATLNDVEQFKGASLKVTEDMLYELEDEEFYHFELIGSNVEIYDGKILGEITSIMETPANDIFIVKKDDKEILIPFIKSIVAEVDLENKKIKLFEVEGLW